MNSEPSKEEERQDPEPQVGIESPVVRNRWSTAAWSWVSEFEQHRHDESLPANVRNNPDLISSRLAALQLYQLIFGARAPQSSFNRTAAGRGEAIFNGKAQCAVCHVPPTFTEPGWNMHTPAEIGIDDFQAKRSLDERYRTSPLKGLWSHQTGGFYHDGRFATLPDVVNHYNNFGRLNLTDQEKRDPG